MCDGDAEVGAEAIEGVVVDVAVHYESAPRQGGVCREPFGDDFVAGIGAQIEGLCIAEVGVRGEHRAVDPLFFLFDWIHGNAIGGGELGVEAFVRVFVAQRAFVGVECAQIARANRLLHAVYLLAHRRELTERRCGAVELIAQAQGVAVVEAIAHVQAWSGEPFACAFAAHNSVVLILHADAY